MPSLISENIKSALVEQLGMEIGNSNFYMRVSVFLKSRGLENLAEHFYSQTKEEREHADIIYKLLTDLNEDFSIPEIPEMNVNYNNFLELAEEYLKKEETTTISLREIKEMAEDDTGAGGSVVESVMLSMIATQQKELEESSTMVDKANLLKEWWQVALWDLSLGKGG